MSIESLLKVTVYGPLAEKAKALSGLQALGCVHLISLGSGETRSAAGPSPRARTALAFLRGAAQQWHQDHDPQHFDAEKIEQRVLEIRGRLQELWDLRDFLRRRIGDLEPWGDFVLPDTGERSDLRFWFYIIPHYRMRQLERRSLIWRVVNRDNRFCYVVVIAREEPTGMPAERTHTGTHSLSELRRRLETVELEMDELEADRSRLTRWRDQFARSLHRLEDRAALIEAAGCTLDAEAVFALHGWTPAKTLPALLEFSRGHGLALVAEQPAPGDRPPTLLKTPEAVQVGSDLVGFYLMPGYRTWDPSLAVLFSFCVFFAMILSDAGYAMVLALVTTVSWRRMGSTVTGRHLRVLMASLSGFSLLWGILCGSYFGLPPRAGSPLAALAVVDVRDPRSMMSLSVLIGAAHIVIANLAAAWSRRGTLQALAPLGWTALLFAALFAWKDWQSGGSEALRDTAAGLAAAGGLAVLMCTSTRRELHWRLLDGMLALTRAVGAFGDVLSYLRLFALGFASASLALAFNDLARQILAFPGLAGGVLALAVLAVGHGINFGLCVVSGFVHGLRLNFIEFFNWGIPEEGYRFRAFARREGAEWKTS